MGWTFFFGRFTKTDRIMSLIISKKQIEELLLSLNDAACTFKLLIVKDNQTYNIVIVGYSNDKFKGNKQKVLSTGAVINDKDLDNKLMIAASFIQTRGYFDSITDESLNIIFQKFLIRFKEMAYKTIEHTDE